MDRKQVGDILEKIQIHRQSFLITKPVLNEWARVLEPYDFEDVNNKLDEYFKDSDNFGRYPDVFYLVKFLKTIEEKNDIIIPKIICKICRKKVDYENYNKHFGRCSSIEYLDEMSKRYLEKDLNRDKLYSMDDLTFEKNYYGICRKIYDKMPDGFPKHLLENVLLTYVGKLPNYKLNEITEDLFNDRIG